MSVVSDTQRGDSGGPSLMALADNAIANPKRYLSGKQSVIDRNVSGTTEVNFEYSRRRLLGTVNPTVHSKTSALSVLNLLPMGRKMRAVIIPEIIYGRSFGIGVGDVIDHYAAAIPVSSNEYDAVLQPVTLQDELGLSVADKKIGLPTSLADLLSQRLECEEYGYQGAGGGRPATKGAHPFTYAVFFACNAPRVLGKDRGSEPIGYEPAKQRASNHVDPEFEPVVPHEWMRSTAAANLARAT